MYELICTICTWHAHDMHMTYVHDMHVTCTWYAHEMHRYTRHVHDMLIVDTDNECWGHENNGELFEAKWFQVVMRRTAVAGDSCVYRNATLLREHKTFVLLIIILRPVKDWDLHFCSCILPKLNCSITESEFSCCPRTIQICSHTS